MTFFAKKLTAGVLCCCLTVSVFFGLPSNAAEKPSVDDINQRVRPGEYILTFESGRIQKISVDPSIAYADLVQTIGSHDTIIAIEPNYLVHISAFPNDPFVSQQSYLDTVRARDAWSQIELVRQQESIIYQSTIAVIDTGVERDHPDLKDIIWNNQGEIPGDGRDNDNNGFTDDTWGWDFVSEDNYPAPDSTGQYTTASIQHGTLVAGIAAAQSHNKQGVAGMSWHTSIMSLRALDSTGSGDVFNVIRAIDYAIDQNVDVINMSFIGAPYSQVFVNAIQRAYDAGIVVVAAAGNTNPEVNGNNLDIQPSYPVCFKGRGGENIILGVASVGLDDRKSAFSSYGNCVDIAAPGENVFSTQAYKHLPSVLDAQYYSGGWSGTSMATPMVSGAVAALAALRPTATADQLITALTTTARNSDNVNTEFIGQLGAGVLDFDAAVTDILDKRASTASVADFLVLGLGRGSYPQVRVINRDGEIQKEFSAYNPTFTGPINVAVGDVNGDGQQDIVTGAGEGGGPHVRIFSFEGRLLSEFFAFDATNRSGVFVAVGDVTGDGRSNIVTSSGYGSEPMIRIYDHKGVLLSEFLAYGEGFTGGVNIAVGDVTGDGIADIVTGAGEGGGPHVRIFDYHGNVLGQFFGFNKEFRGGVRVAVGDTTGSGVKHIMVAIQGKSLPAIRIFDRFGTQVSAFYTSEPIVSAGDYIAAGDVTGDGIDDIIIGSGEGESAQIQLFTPQGVKISTANVHHQDYRGGVRVGVYTQ